MLLTQLLIDTDGICRITCHGCSHIKRPNLSVTAVTYHEWLPLEKKPKEEKVQVKLSIVIEGGKLKHVSVINEEDIDDNVEEHKERVEEKAEEKQEEEIIIYDNNVEEQKAEEKEDSHEPEREQVEDRKESDEPRVEEDEKKEAIEIQDDIPGGPDIDLFVTPPRNNRRPRRSISTPSPPSGPLPYAGGKQKVANGIYEAICKVEKERELDYQQFFEPFCGLLSVGLLAAADGRSVIACDANPDIVTLWRGLKDKWRPGITRCSKTEYERFAAEEKGSSPLRTYVGLVWGYSGPLFGQYHRGKRVDAGLLSTYNSKFDNIQPLLQSISFEDTKSYIETYPSPSGMLVYCDPPPESNQNLVFDRELFWDTMRKWSEDNLVFISEREAPDDFEVVWEKHLDKLFTKRL